MRINWPRRPWSLQLRLTGFISLATIAAFAAFAGIMLHSVQNHFAEQDVASLQQINVTLSSILQNPADGERQKIDKIGIILSSYRPVSVLLLGPDRRVLYRSTDGPDFMPLLHSQSLRQRLNDGQALRWTADAPTTAHVHARGQTTYRVVASSIAVPYHGGQGTATLLMALSIDFHLHYLDALKDNLLMIAAAMSLLVILVVLVAVRKGHQPLRNVSREIKNITSEDLDVRLDPAQVPIELEQLVVSFNLMMARIEDVFTRQANFSADIAHEIRTPITNLVTQTEIALSQRRSDKELEDVLYSSLEEYRRMARMVSDMLFLAQADNNQLIPERAPLDLRAETIKVFEFFEAWAEERTVALKLEGNACLVEGDPLMLRRVINNLLSNAIRHTPPGLAVTVYIYEHREWVEVIVENPGTPIPERHLARIFDRFYRVDPSRQRKDESNGIGLAIVQSIVTAHQGKISVTSDGRATRFTFRLPRINRESARLTPGL